MSKHTPTARPWVVECNPSEHNPPDFSCVKITVGPPTGHTIAFVDPYNEMPAYAEANAEYIIKCVNAHAGLVEALREIAEQTDPMARERPQPIKIHKQARAALAKDKT